MIKFFRGIKYAIDHAKQSEIDLANLKASSDTLAQLYYVGKTAIRKDTGERKEILDACFIKGKLCISVDSFFNVFGVGYEPIQHFTITSEEIKPNNDATKITASLAEIKFDLDVMTSSPVIELKKRVSELEKQVKELKKLKKK